MSHMSAYFSAENVSGKHDVKQIKRELDAFPGVMSVSVSPGGQIAVDYDMTGVDQEQLQRRLKELGHSADSKATKRLTD